MLLRPLAQVVTRVGGNGNAFLDALDVDPSEGLDAFVEAGRVDAALDAIAKERGDDALGLTLAEAAAMYPLGFFDHLVWPGATIREALTRSKRFYGLLTSRSVLSFDEKDATATLAQVTAKGAPRGTVLTEMAFGSVVLRARAAAGALRVRDVRFIHARCAPASRYAAVFDAPVQFESTTDAIDVDRAELDRTLGTADPIAAAALEAQAIRMTKAIGLDERFLETAREGIRRALGGQEQSLTSVARALRISERTLQRRLQEHGTSLRTLVDEVRKDIATKKLREGTSTAVLAYELGFATTQAFHKAFVRWTGSTPGAFRAAK